MAEIESDEEPTRVAICIASCRRPDGLRALLRSLDALVFTGTPPALRVIVADNDPDGSAAPVCEQARAWLRHPLLRVEEKRRGAPHARNASLAPALGQCDYVAFVDDDETVDAHWLDALLRVRRESGAAAVTGPVETRFATPPADWLVEGAFHAYPRFAEGASRPWACTNNALVCASALVGLGALFDTSLDLGEDTELFSRLARAGHEIVWTNEARVFEHVPPERATLAWVLRRGVREGIAQTRIERRLGTRGDAVIALRGVGGVLLGVARAALPLPRGRAFRARGLKAAALGVGRWLGLASEWRASRRGRARSTQ